MLTGFPLPRCSSQSDSEPLPEEDWLRRLLFLLFFEDLCSLCSLLLFLFLRSLSFFPFLLFELFFLNFSKIARACNRIGAVIFREHIMQQKLRTRAATCQRASSTEVMAPPCFVPPGGAPCVQGLGGHMNLGKTEDVAVPAPRRKDGVDMHTAGARQSIV